MKAFQRATAQSTSPVQNRVRNLITKALGSVWLEPVLLENVISAVAAELEQAETTAINALAANAELRSVIEQYIDQNNWEWDGSVEELPGWLGGLFSLDEVKAILANPATGKGWVSPENAAKLTSEITFLRMCLQGCTRLTDAEITNAFAIWQPEGEQHSGEVL